MDDYYEQPEQVEAASWEDKSVDVLKKSLEDKKQKDEVMKKNREQIKTLKKPQITTEKKKPPQSTAEFLNMTLTPPIRDIVEMITPSKERTSTAITPYKGQQSTLDFLIGGTPQKTPQDIKEEEMKARLTELKNKAKKNAKELFEINDLKVILQHNQILLKILQDLL